MAAAFNNCRRLFQDSSWESSAKRLMLAALVAVCMTTGALAQEVDEDAPDNVRLAAAAFDAFDRAKLDHDYQPVLEATHQCITRLTEDADNVAARLRSANATWTDPRDVGRSNEDRAPIFERGAYNDVAACLFIKVAAHVASNEPTLAEQAYQQLCQYPLALVLDNRPGHNWFWSPAQAARGELRSIRITPRCPS